MASLLELRVSSYRSIDDELCLRFPANVPVVLIGENNAGKSNILRALDLTFGDSWPASHQPDDHEFFGREREQSGINIEADVVGVTSTDRRGNQTSVRRYRIQCPIPGQKSGTSFTMSTDDPSVTFPTREARAQLASVLVSADRRLSQTLSYASRFTFLSRVMRVFHESLTSDDSRVERLQNSFEEIVKIFREVESFEKFREHLTGEIQQLTGGLDYALEVDFSAYDPSQFFHALRVQAVEGGEVRSLDELGSGQEQLLALAFANAYARSFKDSGGLILLIDEPEAHLHPQAQRWLARKIRELASQGVQVVLTTHSPAFIDILGLSGLCVVRKDGNGGTYLTQLGRAELAEHCVKHGAEKATKENILPFYAAGATEELLAGFFARRVILVEGPTEAQAFPVYLRAVGLDTEKSGISILPVGGVASLARWWRLFTAFGIPTYVVWDNDVSADSKGVTRRELLELMGVSGEQREALLKSPGLHIEATFAIFGENFELTLRERLGADYSRWENEARSELAAQSKQLIARYAASKAVEQGLGALEEPFTLLADAVRKVGS